MNRRTCPNCNEKLGEYDYYFCSACGEKLPEEFVRKPKSIRIKTYKLEDTVKKAVPSFEKLKNKKFIYSAVLLIFIAVVSFGIYTTGVFDLIPVLTSRQNAQNVEIPQEVVEDNPVITSENISLQTGNFSETNLARYYPAETDFYFEAFDFSLISGYFVEDETEEAVNENPVEEEETTQDQETNQEEQEEPATEEVQEEGQEEDVEDEAVSEEEEEVVTSSGLSEIFSRTDILFEQNYAGAYIEDFETWLFVFKLKDPGLVQRLIADVNDDEWNLYMTGGELFMAQETAIFEVVDDVIAGIVPSFAQEPKYTQRIRSLPDEGAIRVIIMNKQVQEGLNQYFDVINSNVEDILLKVVNTEQPALVVE